MNEQQLQILSLENKRILWSIMTENNIFNGIPDKYADNVKADFERKLQVIATNFRPNESILSANKQIIMQMIEEVTKYLPQQVQQAQLQQVQQVQQAQAQQVQQVQQAQQLQQAQYNTAEEISNKKQAQFQRGLQTKQDEFNKLIQPPQPAIIDFSDKIDDEPIGSDMDIKLAQTIAWREKQLSQVFEKQNTTVAINNGGKTVIASNNTIKNDKDNHLKIGDETNIDEKHIINVKKVSLILNETPTIDDTPTLDGEPIIIDKLKTTDINDDVILFIKTEILSIKSDITELNNILVINNKLVLEQQEKIIDMLERMTFNMGNL